MARSRRYKRSRKVRRSRRPLRTRKNPVVDIREVPPAAIVFSKVVQTGGNNTQADFLENSDAPAILVGTTIDFNVRFQPTVKAGDSGPLFTIYQTAHEPHCVWSGDPALYTMVCWDPDIATGKSFMHWLVVDCSGNDETTGKILSSWMPPSPPPGTGMHRYIIGLFKQGGKSNGELIVNRTGFNATTYATQNGLTPLSYRGFRIKADDGPPPNNANPVTPVSTG